MNTNDILTLAKAGFTAQQIAALSQLTTAPATAPATVPVAPTSEAPIAQPQLALVPTPTQAQAPTQAPIAQPQPVPVPTPTPAPAPATADDILKAMQQMMLLQTQQPKQPTAEDILAEIINPPLPNKEE